MGLERLAPQQQPLGGEPTPTEAWGVTPGRRSRAEPAVDSTERAREICLRLLEVRPRTRQELAKALGAKGIPDDTADEVLARFEDVGIVDDAVFAELWVSSRHRGKGLAGRALSQELRRKGVDDEVVRDAVEALDPQQEEETARALVRRKLASTRALAPDARIRRLAGVLARKGYSGGLAFRVVKEELEAEGVDVPPMDTDGLSHLG